MLINDLWGLDFCVVPGISKKASTFNSWGKGAVMKNKLVAMLKMQDEMNTRVHPQWREQDFAWSRAIWTECAELVEHYGWKWWKKQRPAIAQVKLEFIDIFHFGMSSLLLSGDTPEVIAERMVAAMDAPKASGEFIEAVEVFAGEVLTTREFNVGLFTAAMKSVDMTFEELYQGYVGKNVLNFFRQDHGYKEGTYFKYWDGREDNEHLLELMKKVDVESTELRSELYAGLEALYQELGSWDYAAT